MHTHAVVVSTGDELAAGEKLDTNSQWLADRLTALGIRVAEHITLGDDLAALAATIERHARAGTPLILITGGLGPTLDDLTRQALAQCLGESLIEDADAAAHLESWLASRGRTLSELQRLQAQRPPSARMLSNPRGTAPGLVAHVRGADVFCLPGPPGEMRPMFHEAVAPALRPPAGRAIACRVLHTLGLPEADIGTRLGELMRRGRNPGLGTTASGGIVSCRLRFDGPAQRADAELDALERDVRHALGDVVFGAGDDTIQSAVLRELAARGAKLVTAESCTGGLLGGMITQVPGASAVYAGGWVTYANEFKLGVLGVDPALIERCGAVSAEVAGAMARGAAVLARDKAPTHDREWHALAITGIAGPDGGSENKPVGTVFIAHAAGRGHAQPGASSSPDVVVAVRRFAIPGDRSAVRERAAKLALAMLRAHLLNAGPPLATKLLWQVQLGGAPIPHP